MKHLLLTLALAAAPTLGFAQTSAVPLELNYQATLTDDNGALVDPINPASRSIIVRLYDQAEGGNLLWSEEQQVSVFKGRFSLVMGSAAGAPVARNGGGGGNEPREDLDTVFATVGQDRFAEVTVELPDGPKTFLPRQKLVSTATALVAKTSEHALTIADGSVTSASIQAGSVTSTQIAENAVGASEIAPGSISSSNLAENSVQTNHAGIGVASPYFTDEHPQIWNQTFSGGIDNTFDFNQFTPTKDLIPDGARGVILKVYVKDSTNNEPSAMHFGSGDPVNPFKLDPHQNISVDNYHADIFLVQTVFVPFTRGTKAIKYKAASPFHYGAIPVSSRAVVLGYF